MFGARIKRGLANQTAGLAKETLGRLLLPRSGCVVTIYFCIMILLNNIENM